MNGKIDRSGALSIERGGKMRQQSCVYGEGRGIHCGDWCPQFGEPVALEFGYIDTVVQAHLTICQGRTLAFQQFADERGGEDENDPATD